MKPISISLSPNIEKDDIFLAFRLLFKCRIWKKGRGVEELENRFKQYIGSKHAFSFNSGRSSLMAVLKSLNLDWNSEVLVQAFTCNAAVNPILWSGFKPVYVDCNENFNIDTEDLKKKITPQSKVIMVQHTFGLPADMDKISEIAKENNLILIEDCAHSLGAEYNGRKLGTFGRVSFFSFSRDKIISSVYGGIALTNDDDLAEKIRKYKEGIEYPCYCWIFQQLLHPILMNYLILPFYSVIGKYLLVLFQRLHILSKAVHWKEKRGEKPYYFPKRMPNALALLALKQFGKLEKFNKHRKEIAHFYEQNLKGFELPVQRGVFLRFPIKHSKAHQIIRNAWKRNILIGDWYTSPIAPDDTQLDRVKYKGSCPNAERLSKTTLNLPTHINISKSQAKEIIDFLEDELS